MADTILKSFNIWSTAQMQKSMGRIRGIDNISLHGINRLRELILDIAVIGKLVEQDSTDEPAINHVNRFVRLKNDLIREKILRKPTKILFEDKRNSNLDIPANWHSDYLQNLSFLITKGSTPTSYGYAFTNHGVRFVKVENIESNKIIDDGNLQYIDEETHDFLKRSQLEDGDILFSIAGTIGKTCLVLKEDLPANTNQALAIIRGTKGVFNPKFLILQLNSFVANKTKEKARGGAMNNVSLGDLSELFVLIPPLSEQRRIVAKVDELMALCDKLEQQQKNHIETHLKLVEVLLQTLTNANNPEELKAAWQHLEPHFDILFTTEESIDLLKQTILQLAVMGKLVPQDSNDEPASLLLKKILNEQSRLIKAKSIKKTKKLPPIEDSEKPCILPNGWVYARLNDIGDWGAGATPLRSKPEYYGGTIPWFKSGELNADYIDESEEYVTEQALRETSLRYNKVGDVLIAMYGATIGKTSILKVPATTNQAVCACTPFSGFTNIYLLMLLKAYKERFTGMGAGGAQPNISREKIIATVIGLPPSYEQHRIVAKVDELMTLCDQLKERIVVSQQLKVKLADVIVEQTVK